MTAGMDKAEVQCPIDGPCWCGREACYTRPAMVARYRIFQAERHEECARYWARRAAETGRSDLADDARRYRVNAKLLRREAIRLARQRHWE